VELRVVFISYNADKIDLSKAFAMNIDKTAKSIDMPNVDGTQSGLTYHYVFKSTY
jgi:hypothetical protein